MTVGIFNQWQTCLSIDEKVGPCNLNQQGIWFVHVLRDGFMVAKLDLHLDLPLFNASKSDAQNREV